MKTHRSKPNFIAKPPSRVSAMAKKYGVLEIIKRGSLDPTAKGIIDNMPTTPSEARQSIINDYVVGLKSDGVYDTLDRWGVTAAHAADSSLLDWANPSTTMFTPTLNPTFTIDEGYTTNGVDNYVATNYDITLDASKMTLDSAHMFYYNRLETPAIGSAGYICGAYSTHAMYISPRYSATTVRAGVNGAPLSIGNVSDDTNLGGFTLTRDNSADFNYCRNGVTFDNVASVSTGLPPGVLLLGGFSLVGSPSGYMNTQISVFMVGGALTQTQATAQYNRTQTFMTAIGKQV